MILELLQFHKGEEMKLNIMRFSLLLLVSLITMSTASANPGFNVYVTPISGAVNPGGVASYSVDLTAMDSLDVEEFAKLSVIDEAGNPVTWDPRFSENSFIIGPYPSEKTVTLELDVPPGTPVGEYTLKVKGDGYLPDPDNPSQPDELLGSIESGEFKIKVTVTAIPEFPTIALPAISALGIVFMMSRRKGGSL